MTILSAIKQFLFAKELMNRRYFTFPRSTRNERIKSFGLRSNKSA